MKANSKEIMDNISIHHNSKINKKVRNHISKFCLIAMIVITLTNIFRKTNLTNSRSEVAHGVDYKKLTAPIGTKSGVLMTHRQ